MDFGVFLPATGRAASRSGLLNATQTAEDLGFTTVWAADRLVIPWKIETPYKYSATGSFFVPPEAPVLEPLTVLAFLAGANQRVRLGISVLVLPYRDPLYWAKVAVTLDQLSEGRLVLGVGVGWMQEEFAALGRGDLYGPRGSVADEHLEIFSTLLSEQHASHRGTSTRSPTRNLLASGVELVVYDRDQRASTPLGEAGAESARSVAEVAHDASVIFTSLPGPAEVEDVLLGRDGVLANMTAGLTLFDTSTSSPTLARRIHDAFRQRGASMLDAPISGGPAGAAAGELVLWVGGDRAVFDEHLALLNAIGNPRFVGPIGAGTVTKLAHNLTALMIFQSLAETFSLGVKAGVEPLELWSAMRLGVLGRGSPLDLMTKQFLPGEYEQPTMALRLAHKDAALATSLGRELGVPMRLANLTMEELTESVARGLGEQDVQAFLKLQLERAGVEIAVDPERIQAVLDASVR